MRTTTHSILAPCALALTLLATPLVGRAAEESAPKETKPYPLDTCVVSGEKLGEMGDAYVFKYEGEEVQLCCKNCLKRFKADPDKYLKKLHEAEKGDSEGHEAHGE